MRRWEAGILVINSRRKQLIIHELLVNEYTGHVSLDSTYYWKRYFNKDKLAKIQCAICFRETIYKTISEMIYFYSPSKSDKVLPDNFENFVSNLRLVMSIVYISLQHCKENILLT